MERGERRWQSVKRRRRKEGGDRMCPGVLGLGRGLGDFGEERREVIDGEER